MNSYTKMLKESERRFRAKIKKEKEEMQKQREKEEAFKAEMFFLQKKKKKREAERLERERVERAERNFKFLQSIASTMNYKNWLLHRDILNNDFYQIEGDLLKGNISKEEVEKASELLTKNNMITKAELELLKDYTN